MSSTNGPSWRSGGRGQGLLRLAAFIGEIVTTSFYFYRCLCLCSDNDISGEWYLFFFVYKQWFYESSTGCQWLWYIYCILAIHSFSSGASRKNYIYIYIYAHVKTHLYLKALSIDVRCIARRWRIGWWFWMWSSWLGDPRDPGESRGASVRNREVAWHIPLGLLVTK